ncbi:hypothetical protein NMG60_11021910 [Bertholletia excelsa]
MLRAAEDEMLLNISVNSHMCRGAVARSSYMDPDLDHHLHQQSINYNNRCAAAAAAEKAEDSGNFSQDDLFARFAALKSSLPSSSSYSLPSHDPLQSMSGQKEFDRPPTANDHVDEDEVQKVIQWAIDAARLDPSAPSDDEDDSDANAYRSSDDDNSDGDSDYGQMNNARKKDQRRK